MAYITTDKDGSITASADWNFPGSTFTPYDVTRYPDGRLYSADKLPAVYSEPGTDKQQVGGVCPTGWVLMSGPAPEDLKDGTGFVTTKWSATAEGDWLPYPTVTLLTVKADKRAELNAAFEEVSKVAHLTSSLGYEIDANANANRNVSGLIAFMSSEGAPATIPFCDYTNTMQSVTLDNLKTMLLEIVNNGSRLYARKWEVRGAIEAATTMEEVKEVEIKF